MDPIVIIIIILTLIASFINGVHDSSNVVATMISSRAFSPRVAMSITAVAEFLGPLVFGVAVARTIGNDVVSAETINYQVILAALISAISWNLITWYLGLPSSSSHGLVGGLIGSVAIGAGWSAIKLKGIGTILLVLFTSPLIGFIFGYFIHRLILYLSWNASPRINNFFKRGQMVSAVALALSHGSNDGSKNMGVIALTLMIGGYLKAFSVPLWVILLCGGAMAFGTAMGGMRLIRTVGTKFYKIRPIDGFAAQLASATVILSGSLLGGPVSTTHVVSSAVMGAGAEERWNKVRWAVGQEIVTAWLLTIPATALLAAGLYWVMMHFM
jgi:PiT family inorganic phosphate transporter